MENSKLLLAAVLAVAVVGAAVAGFFLLGETTGEDIAEQVEDSYAEIDDYEGVMVANSVRMAEGRTPMSEDEMERQARIASEEGPMSYEEALENIRENQPDGGMSEVFDITNTAEVRFTKPDRYRYDFEEDPRAVVRNTHAVVTEGDRAIFHRVDDTPTERDLSQASVTTVGFRFSDYLPTLSDDYEVSINESMTDGGVYVLDLSVRDDADVDLPLDRLHVDRDSMLPVKAYRLAEQTDEFGAPTGDFTEQTVEYDYEYDVGVDDSAFDVDVVEVDRPEPEPSEPQEPEAETVAEDDQAAFDERTIDRYDSIEDAEERAGFEISEPEYLPEGHGLLSVAVRTEDDDVAIDPAYQNETSGFLMRYADGFDTFASDIPPQAPFSVEEVEIGDRTGELRQSDDIPVTIVTVDCGDLTVEASSPEVSGDELVQVAESVDC